MYDNLPPSITTENDLLVYEDYLNRETEEIVPKKPKDCLKDFLNRVVKIVCGNTVIIGVLEEIGNDFLIITSRNLKKTAIARNNVKFITVLQNNTKFPYF